MTEWMTPTLALTTDQIIWLVIGVFVVLGGIFGDANKNKKGKPQNRSSASDGEAKGTVDLEEIARRRRQQLEDLARQRRQGGGRADTKKSTQASASASQGETARAGAQQRLEELRHKRAAAEVERETSRIRDEKDKVRTDVTSAADRKRTEEIRLRAQRELERQQRAQQTQQAQQAQQRAQRARQQRQARRQPPPPPVPERHLEELGIDVSSRHVGNDDLGYGASHVDPVHSHAYVDGDVTHRHVEDVVDEPVVARANLLARTGLKSWKHAIMLKEIFDPPISMREQGTTIDPLNL